MYEVLSLQTYSVLYISCPHTIILASSINPHYKVSNHENHQLENPFQNDHFPILILQWYIVSSTTTPYIISTIALRLYSLYGIPESLHFLKVFWNDPPKCMVLMDFIQKEFRKSIDYHDLWLLLQKIGHQPVEAQLYEEARYKVTDQAINNFYNNINGVCNHHIPSFMAFNLDEEGNYEFVNSRNSSLLSLITTRTKNIFTL